MGDSYYYLAASLPILDFEKALPFSYSDFLDNCQRLMGTKDFQFLKQATLTYDKIQSPHSALEALAKFNRHFQNEMVYARAKRVNRESSDYIRGDRSADQISIDVINSAAKAENPLEAEKILDRYKWQKFEDMAQIHFFDLTFLMSYALKLQILERQQEINSEKGTAKFEAYKKSEAFEELLSKI